MDNNKQRINIIEMAKKKRHLHLLEKMQQGKTLTRAELKELGKFEGGAPMPGIVDTQEEAAVALEVDIRTLQRWLKQGAPSRLDGRYSLVDIRKWRSERKEKHKSQDVMSRDAWDAKLKEIKIKREELKFKKENGELIAKSEVEGVLVQLISAFKRSMLSLGRTLAPQLAGKEPREINALITGRVRQIIQDFSEGKKIFKK